MVCGFLVDSILVTPDERPGGPILSVPCISDFVVVIMSVCLVHS